VGSQQKKFTRKKVGMERDNGTPRHVWNTLVLMAAAPDNEMTPSYVRSKKEYRERLLDKQGLKTDIKNLRDYLQVITGIDSDPFHTYSTIRGYKPRFLLKHCLNNQDY
jgi:hypothetical protein